MGARCFWDENTDAYAQEVHMNVSRSGAAVAAATEAALIFAAYCTLHSLTLLNDYLCCACCL